ncbi:molybdate-binding periplasmic protein ModA [Thiohalobacter sp. COW1]|uniref:molybdate ABC transporter substrate-binding protein n=1 Tax=Thiohalobacter sp. COW1 TaxID=2795687 RepID=UPI001915D9A6|nr:molybdate ABC transporter substrate-binding protein [Thiohalobacter sp. COW1]BCO32720.1 molybdate-binding periplasmic protein ModA [Thiohalobacter sp. COW1]
MPVWFRYLLIPLWLVLPLPATADTLTLAVASNFARPMQALVEAYEAEHPHRVRLSIGSTGKLYAQIRHGAPFDAFFAADRERPQRLESEGLAVSGSRFTYAVGRLVLWSPEPGRIVAAGKALGRDDYAHLAIANPRLAPYGLAARQALAEMGLWGHVQSRLVRGENIGQTFHFVSSGHAELGFVALSQLPRNAGNAISGSHWVVPASLYDPIEQQAVRLSESTATRDFMRFMRSEQARTLIHGYGYSTPAD